MLDNAYSISGAFTTSESLGREVLAAGKRVKFPLPLPPPTFCCLPHFVMLHPTVTCPSGNSQAHFVGLDGNAEGLP